MTMTPAADVSENRQRQKNPSIANTDLTQQHKQNPNLTHQNLQCNPQSPKTLEAESEHPLISDPDWKIEAESNDDDVEIIGPDPDPVRDRGEEREDFEEGVVGAVEDFVRYEEKRMEEDKRSLCFDGKNFVGESELLFLRRCNGVGDDGDDVERMDFEEQRQSQEGEGEKERGGEYEEEDEEEDEEEEEEEEGEFDLTMGGETSNNLFQGIEAMQVPFSGLFASMVETDTIQVNSSHFGRDNEISHSNKRMGQGNNENLHSNKRIMTGGSEFDMRTGGSDFDTCMEQLQHCMGKARMMYAEKEQACAESSMNQQLLLNELHKKEAENQQLQVTIQCMQQKRQSEVYRYERELHLMTDLLNGYRKALRDTRKAFSEYRERAPCAQLDGPLYKDVSGGGGLVLSVMELENQRLKEEEEERMNRLLTEKNIKGFEAECVAQFEAHRYAVELLNNRLRAVENQIEQFGELIAKRKVPKSSECDPSE